MLNNLKEVEEGEEGHLTKKEDFYNSGRMLNNLQNNKTEGIAVVAKKVGWKFCKYCLNR